MLFGSSHAENTSIASGILIFHSLAASTINLAPVPVFIMTIISITYYVPNYNYNMPFVNLFEINTLFK